MWNKGKPAAVLAALGVAAFAIAGSGCAHVVGPQTQTSVEIFDRTENRLLPMYWHEGRRYVVGKPGNEYAIRVRNGGDGRILAVMSVDGVNVITGDTASYAQSGYVLAPGESADIAGWRKSMSHTAAFYFTALPDSYAARTGRPENVGVVGVAVYRERVRAVPFGDLKPKDVPYSGAPAPAARADGGAAGDAAESAGRTMQERLGTGHGRSEESYASYTAFERASTTPAETIAIYYDSYQNLLARGVPVAPAPIARYRPDPFPDRGRFVPDPR